MIIFYIITTKYLKNLVKLKKKDCHIANIQRIITNSFTIALSLQLSVSETSEKVKYYKKLLLSPRNR